MCVCVCVCLCVCVFVCVCGGACKFGLVSVQERAPVRLSVRLSLGLFVLVCLAVHECMHVSLPSMISNSVQLPS